MPSLLSSAYLKRYGGLLALLIGFLLLFLRFRFQMNPTLSEILATRLNPRNVALWTAVAKHETANFTSPIFKENNNFFGMKLPRIRPTMATGENRGHATFNSLSDSAKDQLLYLEYVGYKQVETPEQLVLWMKEKGYFTDSYANYLAGVKRFL